MTKSSLPSNHIESRQDSHHKSGLLAPPVATAEAAEGKTLALDILTGLHPASYVSGSTASRPVKGLHTSLIKVALPG
jgi:hypothetical protein